MYKHYRFPPEIIQYAVWLYFRINLSHRDIEELLAQRGIRVTHESMRLRCNKFGLQYAARLRKKHQDYCRLIVIRFSSMRCLSKLMASKVIFGEPQIKMVKSLMYSFKTGERLRLQSDFLAE